MKKKVIGSQILIIGMLFLLSAACFAQEPVLSIELIERAKEFDGREVVYQGEAIGEVMIRGDFAWINVNDGQNAIGIWMPKSLASIISYVGSYKSKGDWLEVSGRFNRACKQHGADLDIHAASIKIIKNGRAVIERAVDEKKKLTIVLLGVLACLLILRQLQKKQKRK